MGKIIYREGDLLEAPENILIHQTNQMGRMASGIAGQIAKRFPEVKKRYLDKYDSIDGWKLGDIQPVKVNNARTIINCCGQKYYGNDDAKYTNEDSYYKIFTEVAEYTEEQGQRSFGVPYLIGCGLGGGSWDLLMEIAEKVLKHRPVDMLVYKLPT